MTKPSPFGDYAEQVYENGFTPIPLNGKAPCIKGWREFALPINETERATFFEQHKNKNIGLRTGRLVAIDNDNDDPIQARYVRQVVFDICGSTPFIRQGRAPREVYLYKTSAPLNKMQVEGVEILGCGQQVVVHGIHPDTNEPYIWPYESILDATPDDLPEVKPEALLSLYSALGGHSDAIDLSEKRDKKKKAGLIWEGERNETLFDFLRRIAHKTPTFEALLEAAKDYNKSCVPLQKPKELRDTARSVWKYKMTGQLRKKGVQYSNMSRDELDICQENPFAFWLLSMLRMTMPPTDFCVPQKFWAKKLNCSPTTLNKALRFLSDHGLILRVGEKKVSNQPRAAIVYRFL